MDSDDRIESLRSAVAGQPETAALRLVLAEELVKAGRQEEALVEYIELLDRGALPPECLVEAGLLANRLGRTQEAMRFSDAAAGRGVVEGLAGLRSEISQSLEGSGVLRLVRGEAADSPTAELESEDGEVRFDDVGGLADAKKLIHRMIVLPRQRPELYAKYGRRSGGGVLFYGPPGCGKTMLARGTAGECGVPFLNLRIEDVLDPYMGVSERQLHDAFESARDAAPCVLFIDELDALAFARRKQGGSASRMLVDQLLQELDAIGADNRELLVLGATNAPWDVDDALKRPGRFDRVVFVPPPDYDARDEILRRLLEERPAESVDPRRLALRTALFSGADLDALVDRAVDRVIDEALEHGTEPPLTEAHFDAVLGEMRPSTHEWLNRAQNFVDFANRAGIYDEVERYLKSKEVRRALR